VAQTESSPPSWSGDLLLTNKLPIIYLYIIRLTVHPNILFFKRVALYSSFSRKRSKKREAEGQAFATSRCSVLFFFQKKKQKALFRFAEGQAFEASCCSVSFFFQKKKQKALFRFAEGQALRRLVVLCSSFSRKRSKKREAEGQAFATSRCSVLFFFQKKKQKALFRFAEGQFKLLRCLARCMLCIHSLYLSY
jgi:hypothetical protein